jgi:flagellar basal-body rod modification protein FlgD
MTVSPVTNATANTTSSTSNSAVNTSSATATGSQSLGINDFMKLLATQFQEQDPLKPMDDTAFIAQTAQFTALQQATTLTSQVAQMAANSYIGRTVSVNNPTNGQIITGQVTSVDTTGATPQILIGGAEYPLSQITAIAPLASAPAATGSSTTTSH